MGDLLVAEEQDLFPDDLGGEKFFRPVDEDILVIEGGPLGKEGQHTLHEGVEPLTGPGGDGHGSGKGGDALSVKISHRCEGVPPSGEVAFVDHEKDGRIDLREDRENLFVLPSYLPVPRLDDIADEVGRVHGLGCGVNEGRAELRFRLVYPRRINEDYLIGRSVEDAADGVAGRLGLVGHDGDLGPHEAVDQA